jgi:hypothetical protein
MLNRLARLPFIWRLALKVLLLLLVILFALFPHPGLLVKQVQHLRNVESLIQPDLPEIADINRELDNQLGDGTSRAEEFKAVERYVYRNITYKFDWFNWGNLDYWPTTQEVLERKAEDCDGRAILATSILRARGFKSARVVGNLDHVWVAVDDAELMSPQTDKNYARAGAAVPITFPKLRTWLRAASKIGNFPAVRSMAILAAVLLLAYHPCRNTKGLFGASTLLLAGFVFALDWGGRFDPKTPYADSSLLVMALGMIVAAVVFALFAEQLLERRALRILRQPRVQPVAAEEAKAVTAKGLLGKWTGEQVGT